MNDYN